MYASHEKQLAYQRRYKKEHREKVNAQARKDYNRKRDKLGWDKDSPSKRSYWKDHDKSLVYHRNYRAAHRDELNANKRARYAANPTKFKVLSREYWTTHKEECRASSREYHRKKAEAIATRPRSECCEICGGNGPRALHRDHNHQTGAFRGWLCHHCNLALGHVGDNPERLRKLASYIEKGGPEE